jgi:hypothetical protein
MYRHQVRQVAPAESKQVTPGGVPREDRYYSAATEMLVETEEDTALLDEIEASDTPRASAVQIEAMRERLRCLAKELEEKRDELGSTAFRVWFRTHPDYDLVRLLTQAGNNSFIPLIRKQMTIKD